MFCNFLTYSDGNNEKIKSLIIDVILKNEIVRPYDNMKTILSNNSQADELDITFDAFSISYNFLDQQDKEYKSEEYNIKLDCRIYFNIYQEVQDWESQIIKFIGCIMQNIDSDCGFEYYGDVVFARKSGKIIVDESKTGRLVKFPYELLNLDYSEEKLI